MNTLLLLLVIGQPADIPPLWGGVQEPEGGFRANKVLVSGPAQSSVVQAVVGPSDRFASFLGVNLPKSDRGKWWLIIYHDQLSSRESEQLLRDFEDYPALRELKQWAKFFSFAKGGPSPAEEARVAYGTVNRFPKMPTIVLVPNPEDPVFGTAGKDAQGNPIKWRYAYVQEGYGLDAGKLARDLYLAIQREYTDRGQPCPGPYCPVNPTPKSPEPRLFPTPDAPPPPPPPRPGDLLTWPWIMAVWQAYWFWFVLGAFLVLAYRKGWLQKWLDELKKTPDTKGKK